MRQNIIRLIPKELTKLKITKKCFYKNRRYPIVELLLFLMYNLPT